MSKAIATAQEVPKEIKCNLFELLLRLGDDSLILGHRLSEWCAHGPILEEDIAVANIALDCIGHAQLLLKLAGEVEGQGRDEDRLVFFRDETDYRNILLFEQPNGDFARTIVRQLFADSYRFLLFEKLVTSSFVPLAEIAQKALKEVRYHLRRSRDWTIRLGDGTDESHERMQQALNELWTFTNEAFVTDALEQPLVEQNIMVNRADLQPTWKERVTEILTLATLQVPNDDQYMATGGWKGQHSEHLGHLLAQMQIVPRSHPDARW